uniref:Transposable element protein, putative, Transposase_28 n=1 Tax=Oryza sativa subsp. japonica TaxID=39947 RepID=Q2QVV7_ORYSJ|nr:hypothetical protein LOC_Os12g11490 [Oryza sativa Japonica Group]
MAPRKPNPASATGPDPGRIDDDTTAFLGASLVDDDELAKLVSSGVVVEEQAFTPGKAMVPKPGDNRTVVFAIFFEAGLRFPCNVWLPEILRLFQACWTARFEPSAELFGAVFFATMNSKTVVTLARTKKTAFGSVNFNVRLERSDLWLVNAAMSKWDRHWMAKWYYYSITFEAGSEAAKALRCRRRAIAPNRKPKVAVDGAMEARFALLRKICSRLSCRDLVEEFCMLHIFPLSQSWQVVVDQDEEVDGLPKLVPPAGVNVLTLDQADAEARKMIGDVSVTEFSQLLKRQAAGRANRVYDGELPSRMNPLRVDDAAGPSRKRMRGEVKSAPRKRRALASTDSDADDKDIVEDNDDGVEGEDVGETEVAAEKAAEEAADNRAGMPGYTPTPSPEHVETGVESNCSPLRRKDMERAKALVAIASAKVAKRGPVKKTSKRIGLVEGVSALVSPAGSSSLFTELNEFDEGCSAIKSLVVRILAAHCLTERTMRARLDGLKNRLRAKDDELGYKSLEMEGLAHALKETKAENKRLQAELEKGSEAKAEIERLKAELKKEQTHSAALTDYYNLTEPKMEALRQEVSQAEAKTKREAQRFAREMVKATEFVKTACQTLRLAFPTWGRGCVESLAKMLPPLTSRSGLSRPAVRSRTAPLHMVIAVHACRRPSPWASCSSSAVSTSLSSLTLRMGTRSYKVLKVAGWIRAHPRRSLEDYDCVHIERREDMVCFWRNHQRTDRQEAIA